MGCTRRTQLDAAQRAAARAGQVGALVGGDRSGRISCAAGRRVDDCCRAATTLFDVLTTTVSALAAEGSADRWVMTLTFAVAAACVPPRWRTGSRAADQEALQHAGAGVRHAEREQPRSGAPSGPLRKRARGQHIITESDNHGR